MSISLEALETALSVIEEIGKEELTFPVGGTEVTLQVLLPEDEIAIQRYAAEAIRGDVEDDQAAIVEYLDRFKVETLARSIVQVGDQDLRGTSFIDTGELLENDKPIRIPKVDALRKLIGRWNGNMRTQVFKKYSELVRKADKQTEGAVEFEPSDIEAEIERLEARLKDLKSRHEAETAETGTSTQVQAVVEFGEMEKTNREEALTQFAEKMQPVRRKPRPNPEEAGSETVAPSPEATSSRQPLVPTKAVPPIQASTLGSAEPSAPTPEVSPGPGPAPDGGSFVDSADMEEAVAAEHQRLLRQRQQRARAQAEAEAQAQAEMIDPAELPPPHTTAAQVQQQIEEERAGQDRAVHVGDLAGGVPVFSQPPEELARRQRPKVTGVPVDRNTSDKTVNPRFRPPRR